MSFLRKRRSNPGTFRASKADTRTKEIIEASVQAIIQYGVSNDMSLMPSVQAHYTEFLRVTDPSLRMDHKNQVATQIQRGIFSANALMPFLFVETDHDLIASAMMDFAALAATSGDPMSGAREATKMIAACADPARRPAFFSGLMLLADRRILELLAPHRSLIPSANVRGTISSRSDFSVHAPLVDFALDWFEEANAANLEAASGALAGWLLQVGEEAAENDEVIERERVLPIPSDALPIREVQTWTFADFSPRILPRLRELAAAEKEPQYLHLAIKAWTPSQV